MIAIYFNQSSEHLQTSYSLFKLVFVNFVMTCEVWEKNFKEKKKKKVHQTLAIEKTSLLILHQRLMQWVAPRYSESDEILRWSIWNKSPTKAYEIIGRIY